MQSRIVISGTVESAENLRLLVEAIRGDRIPVHGVFEFFSDEEALRHVLATEGGPLVIEDDYRGESVFENTRRTCEKLGLAFVHEASSQDGFTCSAFDPQGKTDTGQPTFHYAGRAEAPMLPATQLEGVPAMTDEEIGASVRRIHRKLARGAEIATSGFSVSNKAKADYRPSDGMAIR